VRICRFADSKRGAIVATLDDQDQIMPLGDGLKYFTSIQQVDEAAREAKQSFYDYVLSRSGQSKERYNLAEVYHQPQPNGPWLLPPLDSHEVWAAGVTYLRSREARMAESEVASSIYDRVYDAERPELFLKATPHRIVGPGEAIGIRADAEWNVPEPELAIVLDSKLRIIGLTICNDVSSRDIEGTNPLYLPQAKIYNKCCAVGPAILLLKELPERVDLTITCIISRDGKEVFRGETSANRIKRPLPELIEYLGRSNSFPGGVALSTGTGIVPPDDFTLREGDLVEIAIETIGRLLNPVVKV
jgi:2-dehydro-3-deoxy-D-arabinonate dehydratase